MGQRRLGAAAIALALGACTGPHLNRITNENIANIDSLQTKAVLNNFAKFIDNPHAVPAHVVVRSGTTQSVHEISPSIQFNLTPNIYGMAFNQLTSVVGGATTANLQHQASSTMPGATGQVQGYFIELQNYSFAPVSDATALRNLQALYRHALYGATLTDNYFPPKIVAKNRLYANPLYLQEPNCVVCATQQGVFTTSPKTYENKRLKPRWLLWDLSAEELAAQEGRYVSLGRFGGHDLHMRKEDYDAGVLSDFTLFTMAASPQIAASAAGATAGGGDGNVTAGQSWPQAVTYTPQGYSPD